MRIALHLLQDYLPIANVLIDKSTCAQNASHACHIIFPTGSMYIATAVYMQLKFRQHDDIQRLTGLMCVQQW